MKTNIYIASSWRNTYQQELVKTLRFCGFDVYDFRNPEIGNNGFSWREIEPNFEHWTTSQYIRILDHPIAQRGFDLDFNALRKADACVLLLPSGRSAHIEAGYLAGQGKPLFIFIPTSMTEPELMYKIAQGGIYHYKKDLINALHTVFPTF